MSGIAASYGGIQPDVAKRMLERLEHRGPDGEVEAVVAGNWLGQQQLSLEGLEEGQQPTMTTANGTFMVADGEVYNVPELREALQGHHPGSLSDAEVVLRLFNERGVDAVGELEGKFALVIAGEDGRFLVARDPAGMKPLYWAKQDGQVLFGSELSAFDEAWQPDVEIFPPGHYWTPESELVRFADAVPRGLEMQDQFDQPSEPGAEIPEDMLKQIREQFIASVERQMGSDEEIGVFLSGGLDSSLVAAIAARWTEKHRGENLKTFSVGLGDAPDLKAARAVAEYLGTEHYEKIYRTEDALEVLPDVVRALESFDPSLVRSAVANYILAEFAARHVRVVMIGEGADEIFSGYDYLEDVDNEEELQAELISGLESGHSGGLQRVDRITMAHGIEARLPFLDPDMVELGFSIPASWKVAGGGQPEKRILRQAFDGWLPDEVLWRKKAQFGEGSGAVTFLTKAMEQTVTEEAFERERHAVDPPLRSREEVAYYRIFAEHLPGVRPEQTISRFATL